MCKCTWLCGVGMPAYARMEMLVQYFMSPTLASCSNQASIDAYERTRALALVIIMFMFISIITTEKSCDSTFGTIY